MKLVEVFRTFSPAEAQLIRSMLQASGLDARTKDELSALMIDGYSMAAGGIKIEVPEEQAADARALIETNRKEPGNDES